MPTINQTPLDDPMEFLRTESAKEIAAILQSSNLPYKGPEHLSDKRTPITCTKDGKVIIYATSTPAVFYALSYNGVMLSTGTGEDMLELLITILKQIEDGMLEIEPNPSPIIY